MLEERGQPTRLPGMDVSWPEEGAQISERSAIELVAEDW